LYAWKAQSIKRSDSLISICHICIAPFRLLVAHVLLLLIAPHQLRLHHICFVSPPCVGSLSHHVVFVSPPCVGSLFHRIAFVSHPPLRSSPPTFTPDATTKGDNASASDCSGSHSRGCLPLLCCFRAKRPQQLQSSARCDPFHQPLPHKCTSKVLSVHAECQHYSPKVGKK
jgi:hypothetical protein